MKEDSFKFQEIRLEKQLVKKFGLQNTILIEKTLQKHKNLILSKSNLKKFEEKIKTILQKKKNAACHEAAANQSK